MPKNLITVYHGTTFILNENIRYIGGLIPKKGNKYVYVTTDYEVAKQYSRAWTAYAMYNKDEITKLGKIVEPKGLIIKTVLDASLMEQDPYNPEGEPDQYRIKLFLGLDDAEFMELDFAEEFSDNTKLMAAYCYWIGIGRATD